MRSFGQAVYPHGFSHTWHFAVYYRKSGIRCHVLWTNTGATGGDYQVEARFVGKMAESLLQQLLIVW
jgi:hypothetical protein